MGISSFLSVCNDSRSVYWFVVHCSATLANMQEITCCEAGHSVYYTSCNFITIVEWRCFTRLSKYGISSDLGQSSVKFISAAAAWAWTRWLSWSSMVCRRAAITWNRSVHLQRSKFLNGTLFYFGALFYCLPSHEISFGSQVQSQLPFVQLHYKQHISLSDAEKLFPSND